MCPLCRVGHPRLLAWPRGPARGIGELTPPLQDSLETGASRPPLSGFPLLNTLVPLYPLLKPWGKLETITRRIRGLKMSSTLQRSKDGMAGHSSAAHALGRASHQGWCSTPRAPEPTHVLQFAKSPV